MLVVLGKKKVMGSRLAVGGWVTDVHTTRLESVGRGEACHKTGGDSDSGPPLLLAPS